MIESAAALRTCSLFSQYSKLLQANEARSNLFTRGLSQVDGVEAELSKGNDNVLCVYWKESDFSSSRSPSSHRPPFSYFSSLLSFRFVFFSDFWYLWCMHTLVPTKQDISLISAVLFIHSISSVKIYMARSETEQTKLTQSVQ